MAGICLGARGLEKQEGCPQVQSDLQKGVHISAPYPGQWRSLSIIWLI